MQFKLAMENNKQHGRLYTGSTKRISTTKSDANPGKNVPNAPGTPIGEESQLPDSMLTTTRNTGSNNRVQTLMDANVNTLLAKLQKKQQ